MIESSEKSVADKLRACAESSYNILIDRMKEGFGTCSIGDFCNKVADDIDAEEAEMRGFCERVEEAAKLRENLYVFGTEYMALPLDRDGVPWHVGDRMFVPRNGVCKVLSVGKFGVMAVGCEGSYLWYSANSYSHYNKPAVEDVLRELICEACGDSSPDDETIAKYAAKLRLKES